MHVSTTRGGGARLLHALFWRAVTPGMALALGLAAPASSATIEDPGGWRAALERHPRWREATARVDEARALRRAAAVPLAPGVEGKRTESDLAGATTLTREWEVSFPLDELFAWGPRWRVAQAMLRQAEAERDGVWRSLLLELGSTWWNALGAQARLAALQELTEHQRELTRMAQARVRAGEDRPLEADRALLALDALRLDSLQAGQALRLSALAMQEWGLALPAAPGTLFRLENPSNREDEVESATPGETPELLAAAARLDEQRALRQEASRGWSQGLALLVGGTEEDPESSHSLGLQWKLQLNQLPGTKPAAARAKEKAALAAQANMRREQDRLGRELALEAQASQQAALAYVRDLLPRAERVCAALDSAWRVGEASLTEVLEARRRLSEIRREAGEAAVKAHVDDLRRQVLAGKDLS